MKTGGKVKSARPHAASDGEGMIDRRTLRRLAGRRVFARGEEYARWGLALDLPRAHETGEALVAGSRTYRTGLRRVAQQIQFHCDCPEGQAGRFCKHVVAVGLTRLDLKNGSGLAWCIQRALEQAIYLLAMDAPDPLGAAWRNRAVALLDDLLNAGSARQASQVIERSLHLIAEARWDHVRDPAQTAERLRLVTELRDRRIAARGILGLAPKPAEPPLTDRQPEQAGNIPLPRIGGEDDSARVRLWLEAGEIEQAWRAAQAGDCSEALWRRLAALRIRQHPEDTLAVYRRLVERKLRRKNLYDYADAVRLLRRVRRLMIRLGRESEFAPYLEEVRRRYSRRRHLQRMLDRLTKAISPAR